MSNQNIFERYEMKYLITKPQMIQIKDRAASHIVGDEYGKSDICSLYFDTPTHLLIRRSIERPIYKEKLRLRSYGTALPDSKVFIELKKKYKSVVYKRRERADESSAMRYLCGGERPRNTQIMREIDCFLQSYAGIAPSMIISYEREAFYAADDSDFRITFDQNILWRDYDLSLCKGIYGNPLMSGDKVLMELKTSAAIPLWMTELLSKNHIYKTSFSKYGGAYLSALSAHKGDIHYA